MVRHHDSPKKNRFIGSVQSGLSVSKAAELHHIPQSTASSLWHKWLATGSTHALPQSGRPRKVTDRLSREIVRESIINRREPLRDIGVSLTIPVSASTVRNVLSRQGRHRRRARKVVYLDANHKRARRAWAVMCKRFTVAEWQRVIWSDECYVCIGDSKGTVWITRTADEEFDENCLVVTFKQSSNRVMVWGCIAEGRRGPLVVLDYPGGKGGGMTAKRYQDQVLDGPLHEFYQQMRKERGQVWFQEDGASCHRAKSTKCWLQKNMIKSFPHPASSPDLNPIEPIWNTLKNIIRARSHHPTSTEELKTAIHEAWTQITPQDINAHVKHMGDRVKAVMHAKGGHTKY
jgi:transposase